MKIIKPKQKQFVLNVCYVWLLYMFRAVLSVCLCTDRFVIVPLNLASLHVHCLQHIFFDHLFNVYCILHLHVAPVFAIEVKGRLFNV